jgi:hypothetical protein
MSIGESGNDVKRLSTIESDIFVSSELLIRLVLEFNHIVFSH